MLRAIAAAVVAFALAGAAFAQDHMHDEDEEHHVSELNGVRTVHAWTRATSGPDALVFVSIENNSPNEVVLLGGECECAASVELVGFELKDGEPAYTPLPGVPVRAGGELALEPNGLALRLSGLSAALVQGGELEMEVELSVGHLDVHVEIGAADATQHSHAGHRHGAVAPPYLLSPKWLMSSLRMPGSSQSSAPGRRATMRWSASSRTVSG